MTTETQAAPNSERGERFELIGKVTSAKMEKTIVVEVEMRKAHPKYKRIIKSSKKFYAHDEQNSAVCVRINGFRKTRRCGSGFSLITKS